jgi:hypothetical protein
MQQKYSVNQYLTEIFLAWVKSKEIAIPEIQRPFVWDASKVRDLMDSLYKGYPIGYLIIWRNPNVKLKDGHISEGKKILIDGQQRVIAMKAAILGDTVVTKEYKTVRIVIAFNPKEERFEVCNPAIEKDVSWLPDISKIVSGNTNMLELVEEYCKKNKGTDRNVFYKRLDALMQITKKQIGVIELEHDLDIEVVTDIFIRINSQGVMLSQADFAMSKIAANEVYGGSTLRKCIDYFCHLAIAPEFYTHIAEVDKEFTKTEFFPRISWLKSETDDLYDPEYTDLLRVAFTSEFNRGKLADLVSLLSGRNFETKTFEEEIAKASFATLKKGILNFINETNFKRFIMIIRSAGFISVDLIRSQNALNFAYILYLKLRAQDYDAAEIERYVRRWFVLSILTGRYSSSPESQFDLDIRNISTKDLKKHIKDVERAELSEAFWAASLVQSLDSSAASSPYFSVFLAAQVKANDEGFLSRDITVGNLIAHRGDIHHIFPKDYLKKNGLTKGRYNQVANYAYMQSEINIKVANKSPNLYMTEVKKQCTAGKFKYGGIDDAKQLEDNLKAHCIPDDIYKMSFDDYDDFLEKRRVLMAQKMKKYYDSL